MADDVEIDLERMSLWTAAEATAYFESGGTTPAAPSPRAELPPPGAPLGRRPRIAFLHGTAGNSNILKMQLGPLLPGLKEMADLHFIDGQKVCAEDNPHVKPMRSFFGEKQVLREYGSFESDDRGWRVYPELDDALATLERHLAALPGGGADVLFGFSQGSNMICCLAALAESRGEPLRAVIMLSPHLPGWVRQRPELFAAPLATPAIVAYCAEDQVISGGPPEIARLWSAGSVAVHTHGGPGHRPLPSNVPERNALATAVKELLARSCPQ